MRVTKYVVTSPESDILPSDIAIKIYGSKHDVNVKETCFGVIVDGEEEAINALLKEIRSMDPSGIFIKDRGFPPGDPRRCRGRRGGGARPGFYMIQSESQALPLISRAISSPEEREVSATEGSAKKIAKKPAEKRPLEPEKLEEIIKNEFS